MVPETFEASLMLVSQVLMLLNVPVTRVVRTVGEIRRATLCDAAQCRACGWRGDGRHARGARRGHRIHRGAAAGLGRGPAAGGAARAGRGGRVYRIAAQWHHGARTRGLTVLHEGDVIVVYGMPDAIEHAEAIVLTG